MDLFSANTQSMFRAPFLKTSRNMTRCPETRSRLKRSSFPSRLLMSPRLPASALMARVSLPRGTGARDLTKAITCGETWTLVFIQGGNVSHLDAARLVIGNRLHCLAIAQDFQSFDNRLHPISRYDVSDGASVPCERHRTFCLGSPYDGGTFPLQIRDGTYIFHDKSMYATPPGKSTQLLPPAWSRIGRGNFE